MSERNLIWDMIHFKMAVKIDHETFLNTTFGSNKKMPVLHGQVWNKHQEGVYNTPVKVNPAPLPNLGKGGDLDKKTKRNERISPLPGK